MLMYRRPDERWHDRESLGLNFGEVIDIKILFTAEGLGRCRVQGLHRSVA